MKKLKSLAKVKGESKLDQILNIVKNHDKRFDGIDKKFDRIDKRFEGVDKRFDGIDKRIDSMESRFNRRFDRIEAHFDFYVRKDEFDEFKEKVYNFQDAVLMRLDNIKDEMASTHMALLRHEERFEKLEAFVGMPK